MTSISSGMNKKVLVLAGILMTLVVGFIALPNILNKVFAQSASCSVLHSFIPPSIKAGESSTQIFSFVNWDQSKYDYSWNCSGGQSGVLGVASQAKTVTPGDFFPVGQTTTCTVTATPKAGSGVVGCSASASLTVQTATPTTYSCGGSVPAGSSACSGTITSGLAVSKNWTEVSVCSSSNSFCEYTRPVAPPPSGSGINCSVSPASQSVAQGGSATYTVRNNSTAGVWAGIFSGGSNVTVNVAGAIPDPHPSQTRGKIYLQGGQSTTFNINAYVMDGTTRYPADPGTYPGSVTCANSDPYETLPAGASQSVSFNFEVTDAGQTCSLGLIATPNHYSTILQGETKNFTFTYNGSSGGRAFFNANQVIEGVNFSVSPSGATLNPGDTVIVTASASYSAPLRSYYPLGQFAPQPLSWGCEINGRTTNYDGVSFTVMEAGSTAFTGFEPQNPLQINVAPNPSGLVMKKGDINTFNVVLNNPGDYSGKAALKLYDTPPGITADLRMSSDFISSRGSITGTLTLNATGRVPSGANRLILTIDTGGLLDGTSTYRRCAAGATYSCFVKALYTDSRTFTIFGTDTNFGNSGIPATVNAVEPSILKRVKVMPGSTVEENQGFRLMNVVYGETPFIVADERTSQFCYPNNENCIDPSGYQRIWHVSQIDLEDPLNPEMSRRRVEASFISSDGAINRQFHGPSGVGISRDGALALGSNSDFVGTFRMTSDANPPFQRMTISNESDSHLFSVLDSGESTFIVSETNRSKNYFTKISDYRINAVTRLGSTYEVFEPAQLPRNIPNIADAGSPIAPIRAIDGESPDGVVVLGNGGRNTPGSTSRAYSDIAIYSLDRSSPLGVATLPGFGGYNAYGSLPFGFETPSGKYALAVARDNAPESFNIGKRAMYLYKLDESAKKLVPIIEEARLSEGGRVVDITPIHISGKDFLMVFIDRLIVSKPATVYEGAVTVTESKVVIYSLDELKSGVVRDIASGSISTMKSIKNAESLIKNGETYVYTVDGQGGFLIWKFDTQSLSGTGVSAGGGGGGSTGGGGGSGVTPTPTYDCDFDLVFTPTSLTAKSGTYFASYVVKANSTSVNPFCTVSIVPPSQSGITPFINSMVVSPGGQASMLLNISRAAKGAYNLPVKASSRGVPVKNYTVRLTIE